MEKTPCAGLIAGDRMNWYKATVRLGLTDRKNRHRGKHAKIALGFERV